MTYAPSNTQNTFVDSSLYLPDDPHQQTLKLTDSLRTYADGINTRTIGQYYFNEINTGSVLSSNNPQKNRQLFRKVIDFGALPNSTSKPVHHGLTITNTFQFVKMIAVGNNPNATGTTPYAIAIPDTNSQLQLDPTDVIITTTADYSSYTNCYVILEYAKV